MSTFYGGEQLVNVIAITDTALGVKYTTPSGHYSIVTINKAISGGSICNIEINGATYKINNAISFIVDGGLVSANSYGDTRLGGLNKMPESFLIAGDTLVISGSNFQFSWSVTVREYKIP